MNAKVATWFLTVLSAIALFHVAAAFPALPILFVVVFLLLLRAAMVAGARGAFYTGFFIGYAWYAPQLGFFWTLFGAAAILLWAILALFSGLFASMAQRLLSEERKWMRWLIPIVWMGLEFFRSELYYLKFSWLSPAHLLSPAAASPYWLALGAYSYGALLMLVAVAVLHAKWQGRALGLGTFLAIMLVLPADALNGRAGRPLNVAGMQVEFPDEEALPALLDELKARAPDAELLILGEYTLHGAPPERLLQWCRENERYLIVGGQDAVSEKARYNTAFVIGPDGTIVHKQAKSVPIQFFDDGLPAQRRELWHSPWGKIGLLICYDLSYRRVADDHARQGAQAFIVPMLDVQQWGEPQHRLHARVGPVRAAEYRVPIVRIAGSGISQIIDRSGHVLDSGSFSGQREVVQGTIRIASAARLPIDSWLAPAAVGVTGVLLAWSFIPSRRREHVGAPLSKEQEHPLEAIL